MAQFSEEDLVRDLRTWWDDQVGGDDDPFAASRPPAGTIADVIPIIDSFGVVTALVIIEDHIGFQVSPQIIRPGGYNSLADMLQDLLPKIRTLLARRRENAA